MNETIIDNKMDELFEIFLKYARNDEKYSPFFKNMTLANYDSRMSILHDEFLLFILEYLNRCIHGEGK